MDALEDENIQGTSFLSATEIDKKKPSKPDLRRLKARFQYLASNVTVKISIALLGILISLGIAVFIIWFHIEDTFHLKIPIQLERAVDRNWWNESYRIGLFSCYSVFLYLILFLLFHFTILIYLRMLKRSFATNVSKEFRTQQYLKLEGRLRNLVFALLLKYVIFASFFVIDRTKKDAMDAKLSAAAKEEDFSIAELLHFSRYLSNVSDLFNKYPQNFGNIIDLVLPLTVVLVLHRLVMCWISIIFHSLHFKERIETNDFLLNIFEILKKHQKKSKKISLSSPALIHSSRTMSSNAPELQVSASEPEQPLEEGQNGIPPDTARVSSVSGDLYEAELLNLELERARLNAGLVFDLLCSLVNKLPSSVIVAEDLIGLVSANEAKQFFPLLTLDHSVNLTRAEFINAIVNVYQEKHDIICSLNDHEGILKDLDVMLLLVFLFLWILIAIPSLFIVMAAFAFVFKFLLEPTLKNLVKSAIFISVSHPFDVGDWIEIEDVRYKVKEVHLLTTVLQSLHQEIVYMNNIRLAQIKISNIRRSPSQRDTIVLYVHPATQRNVFDHLKLRLSIFLTNNPRDYEPKIQVYGFQIINNEKMQVAIEYYHKSNFQDIELYRERKSNFQKHLLKLVQEMGIQLTRPTLIYSDMDKQA